MKKFFAALLLCVLTLATQAQMMNPVHFSSQLKELSGGEGEIVFSRDGVLQMHGFYLDKEDMTINLDIIIDFAVEDRIGLYRHIFDEVQEKYPDYKVSITLDVDASD